MGWTPLGWALGGLFPRTDGPPCVLMGPHALGTNGPGLGPYGPSLKPNGPEWAGPYWLGPWENRSLGNEY